MISDMMKAEEENLGKQVVVGASILLLLAVLVGGVIMSSHFLPGVLGEWVGLMVGVMTTPVFLEISSFIIGLTVVLAINHWRQKRAGDDFVYLEQVDGPDTPADLPEHAKCAIDREKPLESQLADPGVSQ